MIAVPLNRWLDPDSVFMTISADTHNCFWLDAGPGATIGWSWIGAGTIEDRPDRVRATTLTSAAVDAEWPAGPFRGGWVGWIGYDAAAALAGAPASDDDDSAASEQWLRVRRFVAFDHARRRAWAIATAAEVEEFAETVRAGSGAPPDLPEPPVLEAVARHDARTYAAMIEQCRDAIREGDAYQLCLTTRFSVAGEVDPIAAFSRMREATPTHHGGFVRAGSVALASASPERFLEVADGTVRTRPIKGTRPRGADPTSDAVLADELRGSVKERAENVMIVDLMRNDLSRVCEAGTVVVEDLLRVESYAAVHQLVSTVSGRLIEGTTVGDLLEASFPAGSMTGAPKLSAMTILHGLERAPRGIFSGCFGWVGDDGSLDFAMVIRSIVFLPGQAYVGAGGGITWRSDSADEVAEVGIKARGPLAALGARLPSGW